MKIAPTYFRAKRFTPQVSTMIDDMITIITGIIAKKRIAVAAAWNPVF